MLTTQDGPVGWSLLGEGPGEEGETVLSTSGPGLTSGHVPTGTPCREACVSEASPETQNQEDTWIHILLRERQTRRETDTERDRHGERQTRRETDRHGETDTERDRQTQGDRHRETDMERDRERQTRRKTDGQGERQTWRERQIWRETDTERQTRRKTDGQGGRQTWRETDTERDRHGETDTQRGRDGFNREGESSWPGSVWLAV